MAQGLDVAGVWSFVWRNLDTINEKAVYCRDSFFSSSPDAFSMWQMTSIGYAGGADSGKLMIVSRGASHFPTSMVSSAMVMPSSAIRVVCSVANEFPARVRM